MGMMDYASSFLSAGISAIARPIKTRLSETISVLDFIPYAEHAAIRNYTSTYDCTANVQAAIDYAIYQNGKSKVRAPAGKYTVSDVIHTSGYGTDFRSCVFEGDGYNYRATATLNGTVFCPTFSDRPVFAVQGARGSVIRGLGIYAADYVAFVDTNAIGASSAPLFDDTIAGNWNCPTLSPTQDARHAPFAAIAIDPYSGSVKAAKTITAATKANPGVITSTAHGFSDDEVILIAGVGGMTQLNGNYYRVTLLTANTFSLKNWATGAAIDTSAFGTFTSGGTAQSPMYPAKTYPSFLGAVAQYGKNFSSDVLIEDVYIAGFAVAVVNQPCDADGNGDFTVLRRVYTEKNKWGVSVGNAQARNTELHCTKHSREYACITNERHGKQTGKFASAIIDMSVFGAINVMECSTFYAQPLVFIGMYAESLHKIGNARGTSTNEIGYIFDGCTFNFVHTTTPTRGHPAYVLSGGSLNQPFIFRGCVFLGYKSVCGFNQYGVSFEACDFRQTSRTSLYEKYAHNVLSNGVFLPKLRAGVRSRVKARPYDLSTGTISGGTFDTALANYCSYKFCVPIMCEAVAAPLELIDQMIPPQTAGGLIVGKSSLASCTLVGTTLTFAFTSRSDAVFMQQGPLPGDVLLDEDTGSIFFVRSRTTVTVIAELQNNYKEDGSGNYASLITPFSTSTGNLYCRNSRVYTPSYYLRGDLAATTALISNVARDDTFAAWYDAEIAVGDSFLVVSTKDFFCNTAAAVIAARDQSAGTITLTAGTGVRAQTRRRLDYFIKAPPANA